MKTVCLALVAAVAVTSARPAAADAPSSSAITLISGNIAAVSATTITVKMPDSDKQINYTLAPTPIILIDGLPKTLADLKPGEIANVVSSEGVANEIDARTPDTDSWGKITSVTPTAITIMTSTGDTDSFAINTATRISIFSKIVTSADLKTGMFAHVTYAFKDSGTASSIEVVRPDNGVTRGKISAIDATSITLQSRKGDTTTFTITAKTTVTNGDKPEKSADIHAGQFAQVTTPDGTIATAIAVIDIPDFDNRRGRGDPDGDGS